MLVTHRYPPDGVGGVERYVEALKRELVELGDNVEVLTRTPTHWPRRPKLRSLGGVHRVIGSGVRLDKPFKHQRLLADLMTQVLTTTAPDVVHVNHLIGLTPSVISLAHECGAVAAVTLHDFYFACPLAHLEKRLGGACEGPRGGAECEETCFAHEPPNRTWRIREDLFRTVLTAADVVAAPSESVASYFERHTDGAVNPVIVANGTWARPVVPVARGHRTGELRLVVLGTIAVHKGAHFIIDALRLATLSDVRLELWGRVDDSRYARELRKSAAEVLGLTLELRGEYSPTGLRVALAAADAVIVPSQVREASPLVPREALAHGVPVLVARIGGLSETIVDGYNGLTFDPFDPRELASILRGLVGDPDRLAELTEGALATDVRTLADHARDLRALFVGALEMRKA